MRKQCKAHIAQLCSSTLTPTLREIMIRTDSQPILTVSQFTRTIKNILEKKYRFIRISGEISNLKTAYSGHSYFTLKDSNAQLRAVLFKQQKRFQNLELEDGQHIVCFGRISLYEPRGEYQIIVDSVELFGTGKLQIEFEKLKKKLEAKGYFSNDIKQELPQFPKKIIVISSPTGAAIHDFLKIVEIRKSSVHILILPVRVQGKEASDEIATALRRANTIDEADLIVLCRGGGSLEDLWSFNEETVADAINQSRLPVVTGVGHEIDFTIADFCADFRCPTPTGAAEKIIPDTDSLIRHINSLQTTIRERVLRKLRFLEQQLQHNAKLLGNLKGLLQHSSYRLDLSKTYLLQSLQNILSEKEHSLANWQRRLENQAPSHRITLQEKKVQFLSKQLANSMAYILERKQAALANNAGVLNSVSPLATLSRGYSIVRKFDEKKGTHGVINRSNDVIVGDDVTILMHEGQLGCVVKNVR